MCGPGDSDNDSNDAGSGMSSDGSSAGDGNDHADSGSYEGE